ncbi:MAG: cytochrome bd-I oxidase subunit CydX [Leptospirales bacterium]
MWYFTWFIGVTMAVLLAVMHALWFEVQADTALLEESAVKIRRAERDDTLPGRYSPFPR